MQLYRSGERSLRTTSNNAASREGSFPASRAAGADPLRFQMLCNRVSLSIAASFWRQASVVSVLLYRFHFPVTRVLKIQILQNTGKKAFAADHPDQPQRLLTTVSDKEHRHIFVRRNITVQIPYTQSKLITNPQPCRSDSAHPITIRVNATTPAQVKPIARNRFRTFAAAASDRG